MKSRINKYYHCTPVVSTYLVLLVLLLLLLLASCTGVRRSQQIHRSTIDSVHVTRVDSGHLVITDSSHLKKKDSTGISTSTNTTTTQVTIYLDTADYPTKPEDYAPADTAVKKTIKINVSGSGAVDVDLGNRKALKIDITQSGTSEKKDSTGVHTTDSSSYHGKDSAGYHQADSSHLKKSVEDVTKKIHKTRMPIIVQLVASLFFLIMLFFIVQRLRKKLT